MAKVTTVNTPKRLPLSAIVELPEFQIMAAGQKMFTRAYFTSLETTGVADAKAACAIAYPATAQQNLSSRACQIVANKKVKAVLAAAFGRPQLSSLLNDLDEAIKKSIAADLRNGKGLSVSTQRALVFYERQVRLAQAKEAESDVPKYAIGSVIEQEDGTRFRVVAQEIPNEQV